MICLDTNVVLRYLLQDDPIQSTAATELMATLSKEEPALITTVTLMELVWTLRRGYGYSRERMLAAVEFLLTREELEFDDGESMWNALSVARSQNVDFGDALIKEIADTWGCEETVTFDRKAASRLGMRLLG